MSVSLEGAKESSSDQMPKLSQLDAFNTNEQWLNCTLERKLISACSVPDFILLVITQNSWPWERVGT